MIEIIHEHIHHRIRYYAGSWQRRTKRRMEGSDRINYTLL